MSWSFLLASWFGIGLLKMPGRGTCAALTALPIQWLLSGAAPLAFGAVVIAVVMLGFASSAMVARVIGQHDPQVIVIDEAAGALLALWVAGGAGPWGALAALFLFRVVDIWKPWPIDRLGQLPTPAIAIMADDLAAGLIAGLLIRLLA